MVLSHAYRDMISQLNGNHALNVIFGLFFSLKCAERENKTHERDEMTRLSGKIVVISEVLFSL